jgi:hypothetical protein
VAERVSELFGISEPELWSDVNFNAQKKKGRINPALHIKFI